jgi:hypothetical protein
MLQQVRSWRWVAIGAVLLGGCSKGGGQATAPVSGTVKVNGQPVQGAQVVFMPKQGGARAANGLTDAQGKYQLTTFAPNDGAVAGTHTVTISKTKGYGSGPIDPSPGKADGKMSADYMNAMKAAMKGPPPAIKPEEGGVPAKYGDAKTSGLEKTVKEGPNTFDFDLQ